MAKMTKAKPAKDRYHEYRKSVLDCIHDLVDKGFVQGTGGNVSVRVEGEEMIAVTPSQREYAELKPKDICVVDFEGKPVVDNGLRASIETGMHLSVYRHRPDVNAVVHTHQVYASVFAVTNEPIPAIFDEVSANIGTKIEVVPYGLSGSQQLLENITAKLDTRMNCYLLQNHGALSLGINLAAAKRAAELLEKAAEVYYRALATGKPVTTLPPEIQDLLDKLVIGKQDGEIQRKSAAAPAS